MKKHYVELDRQVKGRTSALTEANKQLKQDLADRRKADDEKQKEQRLHKSCLAARIDLRRSCSVFIIRPAVGSASFTTTTAEGLLSPVIPDVIGPGDRQV